MVAPFKQYSFPATGFRSLCWCGDELVDWVDGGRVLALHGTDRRRSFNPSYRFDAATASPDGRFVVLYERLGTKGLLLKDGRMLREIDRSYYQAHAYEYPVTLFHEPGGRLLLARCGGQMAGIACLKRLDGEVGEIARTYVRPASRRQGAGRAVVRRLLDEARVIGYRRIRLHSARFMVAAHALYRSFGFREIEPYEGSEIPPEFQAYWIYMERDVD